MLSQGCSSLPLYLLMPYRKDSLVDFHLASIICLYHVWETSESENEPQAKGACPGMSTWSAVPSPVHHLSRGCRCSGRTDQTFYKRSNSYSLYTIILYNRENLYSVSCICTNVPVKIKFNSIEIQLDIKCVCKENSLYQYVLELTVVDMFHTLE